ncbi:MAG: alpha/beta hydrolase [Lachnospiraceae bacterium]|nr:alpha/beta hydrolase [Lachnospiraceae bacterium]
MSAQEKGGARKSRKGLLIALAVLLLAAAAILFYTADYSRADASALRVLEEGVPGVNIEQASDRIVFTPETPKAGLIFYPGGKVEYKAYAPLMAELSKEGILCILLKMPLNLAVLDINAAAGIPAEYPEIGYWMLAGHSLGGAMAASYAAKHSDELDALVLLAAYSTVDLTSGGLEVLSVYGSEDGVLNREKYEKYRPNLPSDVRETVIDGGCHAYFGAYGAQKGDGTSRITREEQTAQTVLAILALLPQ